MNTTNSIPSTIWRLNIDVPVTSHSRHSHKPSPIAAGFVPPQSQNSLSLTPIALAASIARTVTLRSAPPEMLARWAQKALIEIEWLIKDNSTFELSPLLHQLADAERTSFAASVGAGVTDLVMNGLGYTWRDNAAAILGSSLDPHADFLYGEGAVSGHGVVLTEAHGSFAAAITLGAIASRAKRKYRKQVKPHLGASSVHGKVVHGYSIAFGSKPTAAGAFLHVAETSVAKPKKSMPDGGALPADSSQVATSLALSTHRANFSLMNSPAVAKWIDWIRFRDTELDDDSATFVRIPYAGRVYLAATDGFLHPAEWHYWYSSMLDHPLFMKRRYARWFSGDFAGVFVMEENAAAQFLDSLSSMIAGGVDESMPATLALPRFDPIGFAINGGEDRKAAEGADYSFALFRDGLALLGTPPRRSDGYRIWHPKKGLLHV